MKVRLTPRAVADIAQIADFIRTESPSGARHVRASILKAFETLGAFPTVGRKQNVEGVRKLVTRRYRYLIYFTIDDTAGEIVILTIQHPAREHPFGGD